MMRLYLGPGFYAQGGALAFLLSRYIAADWFRRKLKQRPNLDAVAEAVDKEGWRIIALMRLGAPVPRALQNYLFGLTRIKLITFILVTLSSTLPKCSYSPFSERRGERHCLRISHSGLPFCRSWRLSQFSLLLHGACENYLARSMRVVELVEII
jgi:hypothetical protein